MLQYFKKIRQQLSETDPVYFCLFLALGLLFLLICVEVSSFYFLTHYSMIPVMLFWGILLTRKPKPQDSRYLISGFLVSLWFVISQSAQYASRMDVLSPGLFFLAYLLAFPFASTSQDGHCQIGLKMTALVFVGSSLVMAAYTGLLFLDTLPGFLQPHLEWDGARLILYRYPTVTACILMIAFGFCLYLFTVASAKRWKVIFLGIGFITLILISLTNGRVSMLLCSCMVGGLFFFSLWKSGWKRFILLAMIAVLIIALVFFGLQGIFTLHTQLRIQAVLTDQDTAQSALRVNEETGEVSLITKSSQGDLLRDMTSLNSRTRIWSGTFQAIRENPSVLLFGTDSTYHFLRSVGAPGGHTHNSWLEVLVTMGFPGLVSALCFTVLAVWQILATLFFRNATLEKKVIAMLVVCLLGAGFMEPYLFGGSIDYLVSNFAFFLCLGYLSQWKRT